MLYQQQLQFVSNMPTISTTLLQAIILFYFASQIQSRIVTKDIIGPMIRRQNSWVFIDRINIDAGKSIVKTSIKLLNYGPQTPFKIQILIIPDQLWNGIKVQKCEWRNQFAEINQINKSIISIPLQFTSSKIRNYQKSVAFQTDQPKTYHIIFCDCNQNLTDLYFDKKSKLSVNLNINNSGQFHGEDEEIYSWFLPMIIVISSAIFYLLSKHGNQQQHRIIDYPMIMLKISIVFNVLSLVLAYLNHLLYILYIQSSLVALEFVQAIIDPLSDAFLLSLLGFLAYGWYTRQQEFTDYQIYYVIASMLGVSYMVANILTKINDEDAEKYHFHDSIPSKILVGILILCFIIFCSGLSLSMKEPKSSKKKKPNPKKIKAFKKYTLMMVAIGSAAYLYIPIFVLLSYFVENGWKEVFVFTTLRLSRTFLLAVMGWQLANRKSAYRAICILDQSFMENEYKGL